MSTTKVGGLAIPSDVRGTTPEQVEKLVRSAERTATILGEGKLPLSGADHKSQEHFLGRWGDYRLVHRNGVGCRWGMDPPIALGESG